MRETSSPAPSPVDRMARTLQDTMNLLDETNFGWTWRNLSPVTRAAIVGVVVEAWDRHRPEAGAEATTDHGHCLYCCNCLACSRDRARVTTDRRARADG